MQIRLRRLGYEPGWYVVIDDAGKVDYSTDRDHHNALLEVTDHFDGAHSYLRSRHGHWLSVQRDGTLEARPPEHEPGDFERWILATRPPHDKTILATVELEAEWWPGIPMGIVNAWLVEPVEAAA